MMSPKLTCSANEASKIMLEWLNEIHSESESESKSISSSEDFDYSIMEETVSSPLIIKGETSFTEAAPINERKRKRKACISANCENVDSWVLLGEDYKDSPTHSFRFCPNNKPGSQCKS